MTKIKPFESDGCTAFPDGDWAHCCEVHDLEYWKGGTIAERRAADVRLARCVAKAPREVSDAAAAKMKRGAGAGFWRRALGWLMYVGVRIGGGALIPGPTFRWGFGWPYPHSDWRDFCECKALSVCDNCRTIKREYAKLGLTFPGERD